MLGSADNAANRVASRNENQRLNQRVTIRPRSQDAVYRPQTPITPTFISFANQQRPEQENEAENNEESNEENTESQHQFACPWHKIKKLRSRESAKLVPAKEDLHPRPWGVRSLRDIPCTCKVSKNDQQRRFRQAAETNFMPAFNVKSPAHLEINRYLETALKQIDKVKIQLTNEDVTSYVNKVKASLEKKVRNKSKNSGKGSKTLKKASSLVASSQSPKINPNSIVLHKDTIKEQKPVNRYSSPARQATENPILLSSNHGIAMTPTAVVGTMESTNYFIELSAQPVLKQNTNEIKNIMTQVLPNVEKPKLVSVDGAYFAEVPNDFGTNKVSADSRFMGKRTENMTIYAMADKNQQNVIYAKPKSPYSNSKYIPVAKLPALSLQQQQQQAMSMNKQIIRKNCQ